MVSSTDSRLSNLEQFVDNFLSGAYIQPTAIGPNTLNKNSIKSKSITSAMMNVTDLQAVNSSTGNLSITGNLVMGSAGSIQSGKTSYSDTTHAGYWIGVDSGTPKIRVGNSGHTAGWTWDGSALAIIGSITATTGTIGGFTIGTNRLSAGSGSSSVGLDSTGGSTPLIFAGNATPASAPFQVDPNGNLTAQAGAIGGWTIDGILGLKLGTTTTTRGISTGSTAFYAGNATPSSAPFRVTTAGALTATSATITGDITTGNLTATGGTIGGLTIGASSITSSGWSVSSAGVMTSTSGTIGGLTINSSDLTVPSGKKLKFGASAADYLDNNILHFEVTSSETGKIEFKNGAADNEVDITAWADSTTGSFFNIEATNTGTSGQGQLSLNSRETSTSPRAALTAWWDGSNRVYFEAKMDSSTSGFARIFLAETAGVSKFEVRDSAGQVQFGVTSNGLLIYPDTDGTALGAYTGRIPISVAGTTRYIPYYA